MIPPTFAGSPPGDWIEVPIELPAPLVEEFGARGGDLCRQLGRALSLGLTEEARPPEAVAPDAPDPAIRRQQTAANLIHFVGRYWYLALSVARLQTEVNQLEVDLEAIAGPQPDRELVEKAPIFARVLLIGEPRTEIEQADELALADEWHDELAAARPERLDRW